MNGSSPEVSNYLGEINERQENQNTSWDTVKFAGTELQSATSTTLPPNSRFDFVRNGNYLNVDEVKNQVTHSPPLYDLPVSTGDTWVVGGSNRNAYVPGFEAQTGIAFQVAHEPGNADYLPEEYNYIELGFATLYDQSLSGVPHESYNYNKDGIVLHLEPYYADLRVYKDGNVAVQLEVEDWEINPFTSERFKWDPSKFVVVRISFDLYGAGDATFDLRIRDVGGNESHLVRLGTVAVEYDPLLKIYNHPMQMRVDMSGSFNRSPTPSMGPEEYYNRLDSTPEQREKNVIYRNVNVTDAIGSTDWTVIKVYRIDMKRVEAATFTSTLDVTSTSTNAEVQIRAVHRDFLNFSGAPNPDNDSNWRAPGTSTPEETTVRELKASSGSVTLNTHTDVDGVTRIRGDKQITNSITAGSGNRATSHVISGKSALSENKYTVLIAQVANTSSNIDQIVPSTLQRW